MPADKTILANDSFVRRLDQRVQPFRKRPDERLIVFVKREVREGQVPLVAQCAATAMIKIKSKQACNYKQLSYFRFPGAVCARRVQKASFLCEVYLPNISLSLTFAIQASAALDVDITAVAHACPILFLSFAPIVHSSLPLHTDAQIVRVHRARSQPAASGASRRRPKQ